MHVMNVKGITLGWTKQESVFPNCCQLAPAAVEEIEKSRPPAQQDFTYDASLSEADQKLMDNWNDLRYAPNQFCCAASTIMEVHL